MSIRYGPATGRPTFSPGGDWLAIGHADGSILVLHYDCETGAHDERYRLRGHRNGVTTCQFIDNDATLISTSRDQTIRFWDLNIGRPMGCLAEQDEIAFHIHFDAARQQLLTAGNNMPLSVWSASPDRRRDPSNDRHGYDRHFADTAFVDSAPSP